jgi:hypothetical protein
MDEELRPFARLVEALEPWLDQVVFVGGWAHRLYRLDPRAEVLPYPALTTLDGDVAVPVKIEVKQATIRERLIDAGFQEEFVGDDRPPATHYHLGPEGAFYAEFLTPLVGSEYGRKGERKATLEVGGISSQRLRYIDILLIAPWGAFLDQAKGFPLEAAKRVQIANPAAFLTQKILIQGDRDRRDGAKDALYIHDTIETFAGHLPELAGSFHNQIVPHLQRKQVAEVHNAAGTLFGEVSDTIRAAALMATGRKLAPEALAERARAGLNAIFG